MKRNLKQIAPVIILSTLYLAAPSKAQAYTIVDDRALFDAMDVEPEVATLGSNPRLCPDSGFFNQPINDKLQVKRLPGIVCELKITYGPMLDKLGRCRNHSYTTSKCVLSKHIPAPNFTVTYDKLIADEDAVVSGGIKYWQKKLGSVVFEKRTYPAGHTFYEFLQVIPNGGFENSAAVQLYESMNTEEVPTYLGFRKTIGPISCTKQTRPIASDASDENPRYKCDVDGIYTNPIYFKNHWQ